MIPAAQLLFLLDAGLAALAGLRVFGSASALVTALAPARVAVLAIVPKMRLKELPHNALLMRFVMIACFVYAPNQTYTGHQHRQSDGQQPSNNLLHRFHLIDKAAAIIAQHAQRHTEK